MMTMLFIHGTGVREDGFQKTYRFIVPKIQALGYEPAECCWGDSYGSKFSGVALPSYVAEQERKQLAMWSMLLQDPFAELRLMEGAPDAPGLSNHGEILWPRLLNTVPSDKTVEKLHEIGLAPFASTSGMTSTENRLRYGFRVSIVEGFNQSQSPSMCIAPPYIGGYEDMGVYV